MCRCMFACMHAGIHTYIAHVFVDMYIQIHHIATKTRNTSNGLNLQHS